MHDLALTHTHFAFSIPTLTQTHTHFLLVNPVVRLSHGRAGELVKRLDTSSKVQSSRKDSHWAWHCSLGFTGLLSNYSTPPFPCFFTYSSHRCFFPCLTSLPTFYKTFSALFFTAKLFQKKHSTPVFITVSMPVGGKVPNLQVKDIWDVTC